MFAVRAESLHRSRMSMRAKERLIHQYVCEKYGPEVVVPGYDTLRTVWAEWFGPGGARQRYARSADSTDCSAGHVVVHRPGQVVALDTTALPVKVRETVFGEPVRIWNGRTRVFRPRWSPSSPVTGLRRCRFHPGNADH
jgi:hypothetical protein